MPVNFEQMKKAADELFATFELNKFQNAFSHGRKANLVLEFCEYVDNLRDWELLDILQSSNPDDATQFRKMLNQGIDVWLGDLIKTIAL